MKAQTLFSAAGCLLLSCAAFSQVNTKTREVINPCVKEIRSCGLEPRTNIEELGEVVISCRESRVIACCDRRSVVIVQAPASEAKAPFSLIVYPNPAVSSFRIKTNEEMEIQSIAVQDMTGKYVIENQSYSRESAAVDVSGFEAGTYLVRVNAGGKFYTEQLIVNR